MADPLSSITGVSSGVDWKSLVDQIITLDKRPADRMQAAIAANARRKTALGRFEQAAGALKTAADALTTSEPFETYAGTATGADASGRSVLAAAVGTGAAAGTYAVQVTALASAQKATAGAGLAPATAVGAAGTLTLARAGDGTPLATVTVAATDTLATLRDKINARNTGSTPSGVQASLVSVSATDQRLVLTATAAGSAGAFTLADDGTSGLLGTVGFDPAAADATRRPIAVPAADARLTVDGLPVTRPTNTVSDVVPGVTLSLGAVGTSTVTVTRQDSATTGAVRAFVDGYNALQKVMTADGAAKGDLAAEPMLRTLRGRLPGLLIAGAAAGVGASDRHTLAAVGVNLQRDGTLKFDEAAFTAAAEGGRLPDVRALLADRMQAVSDLADAYTASGTGAVDVRADALDTQSARYQARIDDLNSRLDKKRTALLAQYAKFEASLGRLKSIGDAMTAQFAGLNNTSSS